MGRFPHKTIHGGSRKPLAIRLKEGTRVNVLLPKDNRWFTGAVVKYDTKKALHSIMNDIGETKRVDLRTVKWKLDGIEDCTEADIEAALDRGRRWHKSQSAEFLESMNSPRDVSAREPGPKKSSDEADAGAWDTTRLRVRREPREWFSSSDGDSGGNGDVVSMEDEDEFMDAGDSATFEPPALMQISSRAVEDGRSFSRCSTFRPQGHLDFQLSEQPSTCKGETEDEGLRDFCQKVLPRQRGRKRSLSKPDVPILKRPVGRPPKVRTGYAAIKYAQDIAAGAISIMAQEELCNFDVIRSPIPFVEELQLIFGISRRLKIDKQRLLGQAGTELAAEVLTGCRLAVQPGNSPEPEGRDVASLNRHDSAINPQTAGALVSHSASGSQLSGVPSPSCTGTPAQPPSCTGTIREDWSQRMHSSLVV